MSFSSQLSRTEVTQQAIQKILDTNHHLIQCIMYYQSEDKAADCTLYQQVLHRNLLYLATIADSYQDLQSIPAPPTSILSVGTGRMCQSVGHTQGNLNDNMGPGLPPTATIQSPISNGMQSCDELNVVQCKMWMGYHSGVCAGCCDHAHVSSSHSYIPMQHQSGQVHLTFPSAFLNLPFSSYNSLASAYDFNPTLPTSLESVIQRPGHGYGFSSSYSSSTSSSSSFPCSIPNMQSNQGCALQYIGPHGFYGEPSGHMLSSSEPINWQPYPNGFYQIGSSQYSQDQQCQSQQYGPYHSFQGGPEAHEQRPLTYQQVQYGNYQQRGSNCFPDGCK
ncbi:calcium-responsive transactivator-like isoform X2 [Vanacampus margaritifer]